MRTGALLFVTWIICWPATAQQAIPPQRTITTRPDNPAPSDTKPAAKGTPTSAPAALEQYRAMWQKMTPAQQKAVVSAGGPTPEQYERMMMRAMPGQGTAADKGGLSSGNGSAPDTGALDALSRSLQDLNAVRDGNLSLVQKDACAPELASRIADLKAKLRSDELELNGAAAPAAGPPDARAGEKANASDPLTVAADWFKKPSEAKQPKAEDASRTRENSQLDAVLAGAQPVVSAGQRIDPKSPEAEQNRKAIESDIARVKAELDQLASACSATKR